MIGPMWTLHRSPGELTRRVVEDRVDFMAVKVLLESPSRGTESDRQSPNTVEMYRVRWSRVVYICHLASMPPDGCRLMFADSDARLVIGAPGNGRLALWHGGRKGQIGQAFAACSDACFQPREVPKKEEGHKRRVLETGWPAPASTRMIIW